MRAPFPELAQTHMREIGVEIINNDRVLRNENGVVSAQSLISSSRDLCLSFTHFQAILSSGKRISCDVYIPAYPTGGNATFLTGNSKDARGYANVDDTFTVQGFQRVFAVGDW